MSWGFTRCRFLGYHDNWAGPRADVLFDDSHMFQCLNFLLNPAVMLKRQSVRFLTNGRAISCEIFLNAVIFYDKFMNQSSIAINWGMIQFSAIKLHYSQLLLKIVLSYNSIRLSGRYPTNGYSIYLHITKLFFILQLSKMFSLADHDTNVVKTSTNYMWVKCAQNLHQWYLYHDGISHEEHTLHIAKGCLNS